MSDPIEKSAISLHVICRTDGIFPKGVKALDKKNHIYESVSWRFDPQFIPFLKGRTFCLHEAKSKPSYMGGEIVEIIRRPIEDNDGEIRNVVIFRATNEGRGIEWPPTNNPNEFCHVNFV